MGEAKHRGSQDQRIAQAVEREAAKRLLHQKAAAMRESPKRMATKTMLLGAMMVAGATSSMPVYRKQSSENHGFVIGGKYNWKGQEERLVYLGHNFSGNGYWHQFAKVDSPDVIWCEVLSSDLHHIEVTNE